MEARTAIAKSQPWNALSAAMVRDVVLTVTVKVTGAVPLILKVLGSVQEAPFGAPVQVSEAVPPIPPPPMESVYDAEAPAGTTAVLEAPEATPNARLGLAPWPDKVTVCGEPDALSEIDSTPVRLPNAVGKKAIEIWQVFAPIEGCNPVPQVFVSEKSPVTLMLEIVRSAPPLLVKVTC